ncbi:MAG: VWA domain-containing protein, partial [Eubacteriales bacterium]|nr:VWA domain-containing protein [Eubacteriales bacterium]
MEKLKALKRCKLRKLFVSLLAVVLAVGVAVPVLSMITTKTVSAYSTIIEEGAVEVETTNNTLAEKKNGYYKVEFKKESKVMKTVYVKADDNLTVKALDSANGVLLAGTTNGAKITSDTTIVYKTYKYEDTLSLEKSIESKLPDENGYYYLDFTAKSKNLPTISSEERKVVLIIDTSLSMADSVNRGVNEDYMPATYNETRWKALRDVVGEFVKTFLPEGTKNQVAIVTYNREANYKTFSNGSKYTSLASEINDYLESILDEKTFKKYNPYGRTDIDVNVLKNNCGLDSSTNIQAGILKASEVLGNDVNGAAAILMTDGAANKYYNKYGKVTTGTDSAAEAAMTAGKNLAAHGTTIYSVALMNKSEDVTLNVKKAMGAGYDIEKWDIFLFTKKTVHYDNYAAAFYQSTDTKVLNQYFNQILASMTALPFKTSMVIDTLDSNFVLAEEQLEGVVITPLENGKFSVTYESPISATAQTIRVRIKAKDGITGTSYTNNGCEFQGTVNGSTYVQKFTQTPSAVILPNAVNDQYSLVQDEKLTVTAEKGLTVNDNNSLVKYDGSKVSLSVKNET